MDLISSIFYKNKFDEKITRNYYQARARRILVQGRIVSVLGIVLTPYFIYQDLYLARLPGSMIYFRALPVLFCIIFLSAALTSLKKNNQLILALFIILIVSTMAMMNGLIYFVLKYNSILFPQAVLGYTVIIFAIFIVSPGGFKYIFPLYLVPVVFFIVIFSFIFTFTHEQWISVSNLPVIMIACLVLSELLERFRFRDFTSRYIIEEKNIVITEKNNVLQDELKLAGKIQQNLIPGSLPVIEGLEVSVFFQPVSEVGGDFYDFIYFREKNIMGIFICDVTGHGVPASLVTAMVKTLIHTASDDKIHPSDFLQYLNEKIFGLNTRSYVSAFYGIVDLKNFSFRYARAGHPHPLLIRNEEITEISSNGTLLGMTEALDFEEKILRLRKRDKIIMYTDGLVEAQNDTGEEFQNNELQGLLLKNHDRSIVEIVQTLQDGLISFTGNDVFADDICIIGFEVI